MQRRHFLQSSLALLVSRLFAEGMDMSAQGMDHHQRLTLPAGSRFVPPRLSLPAGQPLRPLPRLANLAADGGLFRASLLAEPAGIRLLPGKSTAVWAYNGQLPGPLIEVAAGTTVEIAFENRLAQATTVHWHGLPVPADQDGSPHDAVPPGGSRLYRFTLPTDFSGTCWYHPHPHGDTAEQVYRGLAGGFIVRDPADPLAHLPEQHLFISDLRLDAQGQIPANTLADWIDGREGQFVLVNGQCQPRLALQPGSRTRLRIWNATSARQLRLAVPGAKLVRVGSDGGLIELPQAVEEWLLSPAERVELVLILPPRPGRFSLQALPYRRGKMAGKEQDRSLPLLQIDAQGPLARPQPLPARLRTIAPLPAAKVERQVLFTEDMGAARSVADLQFMVNGQRYQHDRIDFSARQGEVEQWELVNGSSMDHPFHIHGTQFQVVERNYLGDTSTPPCLAWHDTINLRHAERVTIRVRQDLPGLRMFHCHILEHESLGMMANLSVLP